jgi:hypothetical protein
MIASDRPIRVGDFCRVGEHAGTVESIGLRSTRTRTADRTIVSVPNGQFSVMSLENFAMRVKVSWDVFLETQEEMLLLVVDVVEASGTAFASQGLPVSRTSDRPSYSIEARKGEKGGTRKRRKQGELV